MKVQEYFSEIEDPRHKSYVKHKLADVLTIVMCAVMCRMTELCEIMVFAESRAEFLEENFGIRKMPSKPTMSRILSLVDVKKVSEVIIKLMKKFISEEGEIVVGGEYVLTLKKKQPELFEDVKFYFENEKIEGFATLEKNHGRIEKRICRKMTDIN